MLDEQTDSELVLAAARAVGYAYRLYPEAPHKIVAQRANGTWHVWNPLYDDTDALTLSCDMSMRTYFDQGLAVAETTEAAGCVDVGGDRKIAMRRAIVEAAAKTYYNHENFYE
jgi:hypothetical protein